MLGITPATARWHLHEARNTLRVVLAPALAESNVTPTSAAS
jgi:hypothetical protein